MAPGAALSYNTLLLGIQGSGKGTQAKRIAAEYGIPHVATGDILRAAIAEGTPLGRQVEGILARGDLVPDETRVELIRKQLAGVNDGFVLDGFPRTLWQAQELDRVLDGRPLNLAINLDVPREIVLDRLAGRRVCENCQTVYHVNMPPTSNWICDTCGGTVVQRDDDTEEAIDRRLELYEQETVPIIEHYRAQGMLAEVDGVGDGDDVFDRLVKAVNERFPNDTA